MFSLANNHALIDGNKRLTVVQTKAFLALNNAYMDLTHEQLFNLVIEVASQKITIEDISERLNIKYN
ncbi:MAG: hypothetical protein QM571_01450 [Micrococcaceae bacterium]